jgi:hypothetical protein
MAAEQIASKAGSISLIWYIVRDYLNLGLTLCRNLLCSTFLFGCVDKEDADSRIPTDSFKLDEKSQHAVALLRRLPEIVTPLGVVLIEGYEPGADSIQWRSSTKKDLRKLPPGEVERIVTAVEVLAKEPCPHGFEKLAGADHTIASVSEITALFTRCLCPLRLSRFSA